MASTGLGHGGGKGGATRLDGLLGLLDKGTNASVRRMAATQIGELIAAHPAEARPVLRKVRRLLLSPSWDTRVAAGHAIAAIASQTPRFAPMPLAPEEVEVPPAEKVDDAAEPKAEPAAAAVKVEEKNEDDIVPAVVAAETADDTAAQEEEAWNEGLRFAHLDVGRIMQSGALLFGSSGDEYSGAALDVNQQRAQLKADLGLGDGGIVGGDVVEIADDDLAATAPGSEGPTATARADDLVDDMATQNVSAREQNRLKREAKKRARFSTPQMQTTADGKRPRTGNGAADASDGRKTVGGEFADGQDEYEQQFDRRYCAFQPSCEVLKSGLLDLRWEARHGAAVGLRQILAVHAESVGRHSVHGATADGENARWLEDVVCRLICVLAMDRFGDFVGDAVVAPVRETAAMAMSAASRAMSDAQVVELLRVLLAFLESEQGQRQWEVRHAVLLGVRYVLAVQADRGPVDGLIEMAFEHIASGLRDVDDDVRAVAAEALFPIAKSLVSFVPDRIPQLVATLWDALLDLDDISASTGSVLRLLTEISRVPTPDNISRLWVVPSAFEGASDSEVEEIEAEKTPAEEAKDTMEGANSFPKEPLLHLVPRIWPFLRHGSLAVRLASITLLDTLAPESKCGDQDLQSWLRPLCGEVMERMFRNVLLESDSVVLAVTQRVWTTILSSLSYTDDDVALVVTSASGLLPHWLQAASLESRTDAAAFDLARNTLGGKRGARRRRSNAAARRAAKTRAGNGGLSQSTIFGVSGDSGVAAPVVEGPFEGVAMQHSAADALGRLAAIWPPADVQFIQQLEESLKNSFSTARRVGCDVVRRWCVHGGTSVVLPDTLRASIVKEMDGTTTCKFAEIGISSGGFFSDTIALLDAVADVFADVINLPSIRGNCESGRQALADRNYATASVAARALHPFVQDTVAAKWGLWESHVASSGVPQRRADMVHALRQRILTSLGYMAERNDELAVSLAASASAALVAEEGIELPQKVGPFIKALTASSRKSRNPYTQRVAATSIALLTKRLSARGTAKPLQLLLKNLTKHLTAEQTVAPADPQEVAAGGFVFSKSVRGTRGGSQGRGSGRGRGRPRGREGSTSVASFDDWKDAGSSNNFDAVEVARRGASMTFCAFCTCFGESLFERLPWIWDAISTGCDEMSERSRAERVDGLTILRTIVGVLPSALHKNVSSLVPSVIQCCTDSDASLCELAVRCLADVIGAVPGPGMRDLIHRLVPLLSGVQGTESEVARNARRGASRALRAVVDRLGSSMIPYAAFLIVPVMMRMVDDDAVVRDAAAGVFGVLVRLMPLEGGAPDDPTMSAAMSAERSEARAFLGQLLGTHRRSHYEMPIPIGDCVTLRKYQQECLDWLAFLNRYGLHGALCDDMGLGKTLMTLCMMAGDRVNLARAREGNAAGDGVISSCSGKIPPSLVVCPSTIAAHWVQECQRFFPEALSPVVLYSGPPRVRARIREDEPFSEAALVVTSYDVLSNDLQYFAPIRWNYLSLDEGHVIKNPKTRVAKAVRLLSPAHRLVLTGTPIQNSVLELWSLFDFLMPGFLGNEQSFKETYAKPILASRGTECTENDREQGLVATETLHRQVLPFVLRRLKDDVLSELPPKIMQDYFCNMTSLQVRLYEDFSQDVTQKGVEAVGGDEDSRKGEGSHVFKVLSYLRRLCSHPKLVLTPDHPEYTAVTADLAAKGRSIDDIESSAKMIGLRNILRECGIGDTASVVGGRASGGHRALIFAQLKQMLDLVETDLFRAHMPSVTYLRLDGSVAVANRQTIVTRFNADPTIDCLLLTTSVGGLGLNLVGADTVIFLEHDWNPTKDLQAMDRAHRMGQKRTVNVYRLITRGTLEEKIMGIQKFKTHIANTVVNRENSSLQSMNTETLLSLFQLDGDAGDDDDRGKPSFKNGEGKGMKAALAGLGDLWEEKQYEDEYNMESFLSGMKAST
jgi:TATA-binding protein-associated factor